MWCIGGVAEVPLGKMLTHPQFALRRTRLRAPHSRGSLSGGVGALVTSSTARRGPGAVERNEAALRVGGRDVWERRSWVELEHRRLAGVLAMPRADGARCLPCCSMPGRCDE